MASGILFVCDSCATPVEAWDEGNPYVVDDAGEKRYVYHPDPERDRSTGIDTPHLCSACGHEFNADSRGPTEQCPACASTSIVETYHLGDAPCPFCKQGHFRRDPNWWVIS